MNQFRVKIPAHKQKQKQKQKRMKPNPQQAEVIFSGLSRVAVVAGPGSGKTATLIESIKVALAVGCAPWDIVCITFTRAAADEIKHRLNETKDAKNETALGFCGTLHSYMLSIIQKNHARLNLPANMVVISEDLSATLLKKVVAELRYKGTVAELETKLEEIPKLFGSDEQKKIPLLRGAALVAAVYHQKLLQAGFLDYNSILAYGLSIIRIMRSPIEFLFVDEYQDSGQTDHEIYMTLNAKRKIFIGDPDQSIYKFRGAKPENFLKVAMRGDFNLQRLTLNYRSCKRIADAANKLIAHNSQRIPKDIQPVSTADGETEISCFENEENQMAWLRSEASATTGTLAVLVRSNWQVNEITHSFRAFGIKVRRRKQVYFPEDWPTVCLLVAFFSNPQNDFIAHQMLVATRGKFEADRLEQAARLAGKSINDSAIKISPMPVEAVPVALAKLNVSQESIERVKKIMDGLENKTLLALSLNLNSPDNMAEDDNDADAKVTVSTIHGAKGKEFDTVLLPSWNDEIFPGQAKDEDLAELRRLAFVAITRAKNRLCISYCSKHRTFAKGRPEPMKLSRFLIEANVKNQ